MLVGHQRKRLGTPGRSSKVAVAKMVMMVLRISLEGGNNLIQMWTGMRWGRGRKWRCLKVAAVNNAMSTVPHGTQHTSIFFF